VRRLNAYTKPDSVIVSVPPGLAFCWLMPRLAQLRADLPQIDPWLHISTD
jgi:LysR family glycine cleavage system transcriptional activator